MKLGFAGAGRMGGQMVRRLLAAGHAVTVLAHSDPAREGLAPDGAAVTVDVREAAAGAEMVGVCVHTDAQVREACLDSGLIDAMAPGSALIVHTTCSPRTIDLLAAFGEPRGITVVDAPVSGGPHDIADGRITLYVGGTPEAVERVRPFLAAFGDPIVHLGPRGAGQRVKLLNNAVFAANIGIVAQAVAVAAELGVPEDTLLLSLRNGSGSSKALDSIARTGSVAGFAAVIGEFIGKDLAVARAIAADCGVDLGALADAHRVLDRLLQS
jgi:3-hydroxyisobutyrate dehydrogenase-like beta-hydroxyacid dehydrogenase